MKYLVEFGYYRGWDGVAVVDVPTRDITTMLEDATRFGAGSCMDFDEAREIWEDDKRMGDPEALACEDEIEYAQYYDYLYIDNGYG